MDAELEEFKRIEFLKDNKVRYEFLGTELFKHFDAHLIYTGVTKFKKYIVRY